jgi:putative membrane protein
VNKGKEMITMSKIAWAVVVGLILLVILALGAGLGLTLWARGVAPGIMRPGFVGGFAWPFFLLRGLGGLLFWALIIVGIILVVGALARGTPRPNAGVVTGESPLDILKRRYAKGEISKEQYDEMRQTLGV